MSPLAYVVLFFAGAAGGALNSVAGGGSFIVFPTMLIFAGIGDVAANATTAVALWPAGLASAGAYRQFLGRFERRTLIALSVIAAIGGGLGAKLLLVTSDRTFAKLLPILMITAAVVFTFGPRINAAAKGRQLPLVFGAILQLVISTYGGYFGGGMGIMMLATFTLMGMAHLHEMNALKTILGLLINGVALVAFFMDGKVAVDAAIPAAVGSIAGGYAGAALARRVDPKHVRKIVLVVAWSLVCWFSYRALRK
ncbi:MAG: sulfite exporter TauE/SafE family protein [Labilithrix sp.]